MSFDTEKLSQNLCDVLKHCDRLSQDDTNTAISAFETGTPLQDELVTRIASNIIDNIRGNEITFETKPMGNVSHFKAPITGESSSSPMIRNAINSIRSHLNVLGEVDRTKAENLMRIMNEMETMAEDVTPDVRMHYREGDVKREEDRPTAGQKRSAEESQSKDENVQAPEAMKDGGVPKEERPIFVPKRTAPPPRQRQAPQLPPRPTPDLPPRPSVSEQSAEGARPSVSERPRPSLGESATIVEKEGLAAKARKFLHLEKPGSKLSVMEQAFKDIQSAYGDYVTDNPKRKDHETANFTRAMSLHARLSDIEAKSSGIKDSAIEQRIKDLQASFLAIASGLNEYNRSNRNTDSIRQAEVLIANMPGALDDLVRDLARLKSK